MLLVIFFAILVENSLMKLKKSNREWKIPFVKVYIGRLQKRRLCQNIEKHIKNIKTSWRPKQFYPCKKFA